MAFVADKLYYKIREVCEIVGVPAHVLRFWETEFPSLSPPKSKTGQRTYRPKDIELLLRIRELLYEEGFTIAGARKRLKMDPALKTAKAIPTKTQSRDRTGPPASKRTGRKSPDRLNKVKSELENILTLLDRE